MPATAATPADSAPRTFAYWSRHYAKRRARRLISAWRRHGLRSRSTAWPVRDASRATLVFAPHQDDESLGCGGLIHRRASTGEPLHIVWITDGSGSHPGHPVVTPASLAALRAGEARAAAALLGVPSDRLHFLEAPDGRLPHLSPELRSNLISRITALVARHQPAEIFVTAAADGSTEHTAANALVREAVSALSASTPPPRILEYPVWSRWNPLLLKTPLRTAFAIHHLLLTEDELAAKHAAIHAHRSQIEPLAPGDHPALSAEFLGYFHDRDEFFFQY